MSVSHCGVPSIRALLLIYNIKTYRT